MTLDAFIDWLYTKGISATTFWEILMKWEQVPSQEREKVLKIDSECNLDQEGPRSSIRTGRGCFPYPPRLRR